MSIAETFIIPLASISNVTYIYGIPLGAGAIPTNSNEPNNLLSAAIYLYPWNILIETCVWLSCAVENVCDFLVGITVFLSIILVKTPPKVYKPKDRGATSTKTISLTSPFNTAPWMAAPTATA